MQQELHRYSRQIQLPEFGLEGQQKLNAAKVLVIGAGGLGSPVLLYLAAAGVGTLGIVDFDVVDESNLQRQILFSTADVGKPKALLASQRIKQLNPFITVQTFNEYLSSQNALDIIQQFDLVVDGSDNLPTRYLVNDACVILHKPLVYGAIFQFEGQVSVFNESMKGGGQGPNYRDLFPQPPPPEMVPSCSEGGVLGVLPGIIGSMQANEAIKILTGMGATLSGRLLLFDALNFSTHFINIKSDPKREVISTLIDYEEFCNPRHLKKKGIKEIIPIDLKKMLEQGIAVQLVDVREPWEFDFVNLGGVNIPLKNIETNLALIAHDIPVVVHCKSGARSLLAIEKLQQHGFTNLMNLRGGILKWIEEVNPELTKY